jgi:hypothetical protein
MNGNHGRFVCCEKVRRETENPHRPKATVDPYISPFSGGASLKEMESGNANLEIKLVSLSVRIWRYISLMVEKLKGNRCGDSIRQGQQNSVLSATPLLLCFGIFGGWLLSRIFPK